MMRVNLIGGVPATGKSFLMKKIKKELKINYFFEKNILRGYSDKNKKNYIFGIYNNDLFDGTDKLSMAVQPKAIEFIKENNFKSIFIEGDRLFRKSFINNIKNLVDLNIYILNVNEEELKNRHIKRKDEQTQSWLNAKKTTINNIKSNYSVHVLNNEKASDVIKNINYIIENKNANLKKPTQVSLF